MAQESRNIEGGINVLLGKNHYNRTGIARSGLAAMVSVSLVLSSLTGCVTTRDDRIGADDGSDACLAYVVALDSTGNYFAEDMIKGAAIGALGGALIGGIASGNWQGAAIGAVSGAAVGALGGYWKSKMDQGKDQAVTSLASDMNADEAQLDKSQAAFKQLTACRRDQAKKIRAQYTAKSITRDEAQTRLRMLGTQARKDVDILNAITGNADKRLAEYQYAANQIDPNVPAPSASNENSSSSSSSSADRKPNRPHKPTRTGPPTTQGFASLQSKASTLKQNSSDYAAESSGWESAKLG